MNAAGGRGAVWLQVAPVGEPALGPAAFMHRASSGENPAAPLGHHWHDSSHITASVATVGGAWRGLVVEASAFHGAEPDEGRWDVDGGVPDSAAGRVRLTLGAGWSAQASHAFLKQPEPLTLGDARRTVASIHYGADGDRAVAASLVWGRNREVHGTSDAVLAEGAWQATARDQVYARVEFVEKEAELLLNKGVSEQEQHGHVHGFAGGRHPTVPVAAFSLGYLRSRGLFGTFNAGLGGDVTVYQFPTALRSTYGHVPASVHVFLRIRWGRPHGRNSDHSH
jgi:hypothetical protein